MRSPNDLKPKSFSLNMTPLIDVVFLLIIFFIVSDAMIKSESSIKLDLPKAQTGEKIKKKETGKLVINVIDGENLFLGEHRVTKEELRLRLQEEKIKSNVPLEVRIRTNRKVRYEIIEPILVLCVQTGITNVSFAVIEVSGNTAHNISASLPAN